MDYVERQQLEATVKDVTLKLLETLAAHNVKGVDILKKGLDGLVDIKKDIEDYYEILKAILNMLKPLFDIAREWLAAAYNHLLALFDWAKAKWHELFG